jgi:uncharacterized damage-inducible protein DinB
MNLTDLTTLLDFHYWARDRVLDAAAQLTPAQYSQDLNGSFPSVRHTLVHLYSAEWAWYQRWQGTSPGAMLDPADYPDVGTLRTAWLALEERVRGFLASLGESGIGRTLDYRALDGTQYTSTYWEMLHHVVNHGTYHRGQVQSMFRQLGATPAKSVDLIAFYRLRNAGTLR